MTWKPARWQATDRPNVFAVFCPYCGAEQATFERGVDRWPPHLVCDDCDRTYIIPVGLSRGHGTEGTR